MYGKLSLGEPKATRISLELADRSIQYPRGIVENVLIKVNKFVLPIDFIILDMPKDSRVPIILGRPFLATAQAIIDVSPVKDDECYGVDDLDDAINAEAQELLVNDTTDSFLLRGLEKSIEQSDLENYECEAADDVDSIRPRSVALNGGRVWRWFGLQRGDKEVFGVQVAYKEVMEVLVRFEGLEYTDADITDFKEILSRIYGREDADGAHARALQFQLGGVRRHMSWREFILGISSAGDFLGTTSSYTSIRDLMLRLCHKMIAYSIARRSQAPETEICFREEAGGHDSWRLVYFEELDDTWACVALGLERQQVAVAGDAPVVNEGRLEEDIYGLRGALGEQRELLDSMAYDFSRFTT
ncbi:DNA-directed DNA polymerase [Tanacetum coccineum]